MAEYSDQEKAAIARAKAEFDPVQEEAEYRELMRQYEEGKLLSGEEVREWLEKVLAEPQKPS